ncbi:MAG: hypothetical protein AABX90_00030, partial [Nanoarchaeota archaeon]
IISATIIGVLIVASFFIGYSIKGASSDLQIQNNQLPNTEDKETTTKDIPLSVLAKYDELESQYKRSLGAGINLCNKNNEKIYTVWGSGGFTGVTFYYTEGGDEIGSSYFTDALDPNNPLPKPPVNIQEYDCTTIKKSEQFVNE